MSLNDILGSALSGLNAAQAGLRTVSNNISNINTPGYAREIVQQTTSVTAGAVSGVTVGQPQRVADSFLETTVYAREGDVGSTNVTANYLNQLQSLLGPSHSSAGLPAQLSAIGAAAVSMTGSPVTGATAAVFTNSVQSAISTMRQVGSDAAVLQGNVDAQVGTTVNRVNALLKNVYALNDTIASQQTLGQSAAGASDLRLSALQELSGLVKVTVNNQADGRVTIDTASGVTLLDRRLRQLVYPSTPTGSAQQDYPSIDVRFGDTSGKLGAATGQSISSSSVGGALGGLINLRDRTIPQFTSQLGALFGGLAQSLNAASNANSSVPPPASLNGGQTGLISSDRLGFSGAATFAVTSSAGALVSSTRVDFTALGPNATVADAVNAINSGLGGTAVASFTNGKLSIAAAGTGNGVAIAQDASAPSNRGGVGFSQYFGLNDIVQSASSPIRPSGFTSADPTGFAADQSAEIVLRDTNGLTLGRTALTGATGQTFGDVITQLNQSPLGNFGAFSIASSGQIQFQPSQSVSGATVAITSDSTDRFGTGRSFTTISGLTGSGSGLSSGAVRQDLVSVPATLPLAQLQANVSVGGLALGASDYSGAINFIDQLNRPIDLGGQSGNASLQSFATNLLADTGQQASSAQSANTNATARRDDAVNRRDSIAGVNIDQELSQMVVLQNSYSANARVMTSVDQMFQTLIGMIR